MLSRPASVAACPPSASYALASVVACPCNYGRRGHYSCCTQPTRDMGPHAHVLQKQSLCEDDVGRNLAGVGLRLWVHYTNICLIVTHFTHNRTIDSSTRLNYTTLLHYNNFGWTVINETSEKVIENCERMSESVTRDSKRWGRLWHEPMHQARRWERECDWVGGAEGCISVSNWFYNCVYHAAFI